MTDDVHTRATGRARLPRSLRCVLAIEAVSTVLGPVTERDRNLERSALGIEFMAGGLQGILESEAPTARISDLWSGVNGVAR